MRGIEKTEAAPKTLRSSIVSYFLAGESCRINLIETNRV